MLFLKVLLFLLGLMSYLLYNLLVVLLELFFLVFKDESFISLLLKPFFLLILEFLQLVFVIIQKLRNFFFVSRIDDFVPVSVDCRGYSGRDGIQFDARNFGTHGFGHRFRKDAFSAAWFKHSDPAVVGYAQVPQETPHRRRDFGAGKMGVRRRRTH